MTAELFDLPMKESGPEYRHEVRARLPSCDWTKVGSRLELRRVLWKRPPTDADYLEMRLQTMFGPSCFEGDVFIGGKAVLSWEFADGSEFGVHALTPRGFRRVN